MADTTVLVTGATGTVSTALRAGLKGKPGIKVRALVRDPAKGEPLEKDGYDVAVGDLEEPDTLADAFDGVDVLWLLTPASGLSRWFVGNVVDYGTVYSGGWGDFVTSDFKDVAGHEARSFKQFATDFAPAFGGSVKEAAHA